MRDARLRGASGGRHDEPLAGRRSGATNTSRQDVSDPGIDPETQLRTKGGVAHVLSAVLSPKSRAAKDAAQRAATTAALRTVSVDGTIGKRGLGPARHTLYGTTGTASRVPIQGEETPPWSLPVSLQPQCRFRPLPTNGKRRT
jgi:hypothetical protein